MIEAADLEAWLAGLREDLVSKTYRPEAVRRVSIPKPGNGLRPLGIPTIRDRVAQTAAKLVPEPIFEADIEDNAYGYRPRRGAADAIRQVHRLTCRGRRDPAFKLACVRNLWRCHGPTPLLHRLIHHAVVFQIEGSSYRLRQHADLVPEHIRIPPTFADSIDTQTSRSAAKTCRG